MNKIKIHRFNNTMWGRDHLPFFKSFDKYLSNFFEVEVINYNKDGTTYSGPITTKCSISSFGNNPLLTDVDYLIENNLGRDENSEYFFSTAQLDESYYKFKDGVITTKFGTNPYLIHDNSSFSLNLIRKI